MTLNLAQTVVDFLEESPEEKYTAREIAQWIFKQFPEECRQKRDSSSNKFIVGAQSEAQKDNSLINAIVAEIGAQKFSIHQKSPRIKTTEGRPRKYYFTNKSDEAELEVINQDAPIPANHSLKIKEHDIYPKLAEYLWLEFDESLYTKRIDEKKSSNARGINGNKWLYPDMVALEDLTSEWTPELRDCVQEYGDRKCILWSFEVKLLINRSNVRETYFQAVSNSSWANVGYLVTAEIEGTDTMKELRMLSALHGIGFIKLDVENPAESQIIIPAEEHETIDWDTANRLASENKDFVDFLKLLKEFHQTGRPKKYEWDIPK